MSTAEAKLATYWWKRGKAAEALLREVIDTEHGIIHDKYPSCKPELFVECRAATFLSRQGKP